MVLDLSNLAIARGPWHEFAGR